MFFFPWYSLVGSCTLYWLFLNTFFTSWWEASISWSVDSFHWQVFECNDCTWKNYIHRKFLWTNSNIIIVTFCALSALILLGKKFHILNTETNSYEFLCVQNIAFLSKISVGSTHKHNKVAFWQKCTGACWLFVQCM